MLQPGAILQQRYKVIDSIGKGGMGSVYRARDLRLRTDVALKETLFTDEVYRRAFEHEAQILARLRHQALPRVIDHFVEGPGQFLVMEFIHGEDLGNQLARLGPRFATLEALPTILRWADQLLDALNYLHTRPRPVYHRDIKPKNLKLTQSFDIILLDFGLARGGFTVAVDASLADEVAQKRIYGFTPPYAPIEQMRDGEPDARSDLYALGATLYHMLTATLPVDAMTRMTRLLNRQPDPLRPIRSLAPHVPAPIAATIEQALAVIIDDRPATARVMRSALAQARAEVAAAAAPAIPLSTTPTSEPQVASVSRPHPEEHTELLSNLDHTPAFPSAVTPSMISAESSSSATPIGTLLRMLTTGSPIHALDFSPDSSTLAAAYEDHTIGLWRMRDYTQCASLQGHTSGVRSLRFAPNQQLLASGSEDESVRFWQADDGTPVRRHQLSGCPIESLAFSPAGDRLAIGGWGSAVSLCYVEAYNLRSAAMLPCPFVHSLAFSPDGKILAAGAYDGAVYLWNVADGTPIETLTGFPTFILTLAFSPDGAFMAASSQNRVRIWRMSDRKPIELLQGHRGPVHSLAFSPDRSLLATGSEDHTVRLWQVRDWNSIATPLEHRAGVASLAFSPDGATIASGTHDGRICLWRIKG